MAWACVSVCICQHLCVHIFCGGLKGFKYWSFPCTVICCICTSIGRCVCVCVYVHVCMFTLGFIFFFCVCVCVCVCVCAWTDCARDISVWILSVCPGSETVRVYLLSRSTMTNTNHDPTSQTVESVEDLPPVTSTELAALLCLVRETRSEQWAGGTSQLSGISTTRSTRYLNQCSCCDAQQ